MNTLATIRDTQAVVCRDDGSPHFSPSFIHEAALAYLAAGLSYIPIAGTGDKRPAFELLPKVRDTTTGRTRSTWKVFRERRPTEQEVSKWFRAPNVWYHPGLAVLGGEISGGLEIIDFDSWDILLEWLAIAEKNCPALIPKVVWVRSPRPGMHGYFRSDQCEGSQKLAQRLLTGTKQDVKTLIETKGEGGYVLAPPSPGACHPLGGEYRFVTGRDLTQIQKLSRRERAALLDSARSLNTYEPPTRRPPANMSGRAANCYHGRPGDAFNADANWPDILNPHGWTYLGEGSDGVQLWSRPGKGDGTSATTNFAGADLLHVFSANAAPFEPGRSYSKFHAYALLEHGGNFRSAARKLEREGYGDNLSLAGPLPSLSDDYKPIDATGKERQR